MKWEHWQMGWGESAKLAPGLILTVGKEMDRSGKFFASIFGRKLKQKFDNINNAKSACEMVAFKWLNQALEELSNDTPHS